MEFDKDILELANRIGDFIEYWGFRKIDGKVWVLIYLSEEPIDAGILIENLDVSKGLISTTIKTLIDYELIEEINHGDKRSKYYRALEDPMNAIVNVLNKRERNLIQGVDNLFKEISNKKYAHINNKRLKSLSRLTRIGHKLVNQIIKFKKLLLE